MHEKSRGKNYENKELQSRRNGSETGGSVSGIALSLSPTWAAVGDGGDDRGVCLGIYVRREGNFREYAVKSVTYPMCNFHT